MYTIFPFSVIILIIIGICAASATLIGGLFALKFKDKLHLILGFSAGAVIGVAFFDLLPEAISLSNSTFSASTITSIVAVGFVVYLILDRCAVLHTHTSDDHELEHIHETKSSGRLGAGSLAIHSLLDGVAIGLAFQASPTVGVIVTVAVLVHDFSDGINTVSLILRRRDDQESAIRWLIVDALAPILGIISTLFFTLSASSLGIILALFCGFFIYIGASDLLPESHHNHPTVWTTVMTILGVVVLYGAISLAHL